MKKSRPSSVHQSRFGRIRISLLAVAALCAGLACGHAATLTWSGGGPLGNANWNDSGNWGFAGTPASGDTLIFPASQPKLSNTNNIAGLTLNQIRFAGPSGGYAIYGNSFTLTNGIAATNAAGANTINNDIAIGVTNAVVNVSATASLNLNGQISGSFGVTKTGTGTLQYAGGVGNTYAGATRVNTGTLLLNRDGIDNALIGPLIVSDGSGSALVQWVQSTELPSTIPITVNGGGTLDLNGKAETIGINLTLNNGGGVTTGIGTLTLASSATVVVSGSPASTIAGNLNVGSGTCTFALTNDLNVAAVVSGSATILKTGPSGLHFSNANSYTGLTVINSGFLWAENSLALGTAASGTVVSNGASLVLDSASGITNESLVLNGPGVNTSWGALDVETNPGTNIWAGPITVNADGCTITPYYVGTSLRIIGVIDGTGGITKFANSAGKLYYEGAANTYTGTTRVFAGTLQLSKSATDGSIHGPLIIGDGTGGANADIVRLGGSEQISDSMAITIDSSGLLDLAGTSEYFGSLAGSGNLTAGTAQPRIGYNNTSTTFSGVVSGTGGLLKAGLGVLTFNGNNSYSGTTFVDNGTLLVNGFQPSSPVTVELGGTLGGSGTVGAITVTSGKVAPGSSPGILNSGAITFNASTTFQVELLGNIAGTGFDQLNVTGAANLTGSTLSLAGGGGFAPLEGQPIVILKNDLADAITGTFNGLPEGSVITVGMLKLRLSYAGGTGNDVTLTLTNPPAKGLTPIVSAGNGNHVIDVNECNNFQLVVTNTTGSPMTGVTGTIMSTTPGVFITQASAPYADLPVGGTSTNTAPFQISTLPYFACGSSVDLVLTLNTASGSFAVPFTFTASGLGNTNRFDYSVVTNILDFTTNDLPLTVSGIVGPIGKVTVSMNLTHTFDQDLQVFLIAPNGPTVELTSGNGGSGQNYGIACGVEASRTTFDDAAATSVTAGVAPFLGSYRPEGSLAAFNGLAGGDVNGVWKLRVIDASGGDVGVLKCWSLFISPLDCQDGGGNCVTCPGYFTNSITGADLLAPSRLSRSGITSTCAAPTPCPNTVGDATRYDVYTFTNTGGDTCFTAFLNAPCALFAAAYLGTYDPNNQCTGYLGDLGYSYTSAAFSFSVPAGAKFSIVVNEIPTEAGGCDYALSVTGGQCPPQLNIAPVPGNKVRLYWPTSAGGYSLESAPIVAPGTWSGVANEPVVSGANYNVTNTMNPTNQFYRLRKP